MQITIPSQSPLWILSQSIVAIEKLSLTVQLGAIVYAETLMRQQHMYIFDIKNYEHAISVVGNLGTMCKFPRCSSEEQRLGWVWSQSSIG